VFQVFSGMCGLPNDRIAALLTVGVILFPQRKSLPPERPVHRIAPKDGKALRAAGRPNASQK